MEITDKLSTLTTIEKKTLEKFFRKIEWCICDDLYTCNLENNHKCLIDIGIGKLGIDFSSGDTVSYRFFPSKELEKGIVSTLVDGNNPLSDKIEQSLVDKLTKTYKDLF